MFFWFESFAVVPLCFAACRFEGVSETFALLKFLNSSFFGWSRKVSPTLFSNRHCVLVHLKKNLEFDFVIKIVV